MIIRGLLDYHAHFAYSIVVIIRGLLDYHVHFAYSIFGIIRVLLDYHVHCNPAKLDYDNNRVGKVYMVI
jgi:hypothetical protein